MFAQRLSTTKAAPSRSLNREIDITYPQPGHVELDPISLWQNTETVCEKAFESGEARLVGVDGHRYRQTNVQQLCFGSEVPVGRSTTGLFGRTHARSSERSRFSNKGS